jgi:Flp pilus assembly protein TadD
MMTETIIAPRIACAVLTMVLAFVVYHDRSSVRTRLAVYATVILVAIANILVNAPQRIRHSNQAHYYVGAKYALSYAGFYSVVTAAREHPQVNFRDLGRPDRMFRADPREQRLYYAGLLSDAGISVPRGAGTDELRGLCASNGLIQAEAWNILEGAVGPDRIAPLKNDLSRTDLDTDDQGFNGSPFYVLVRRLDPSLHMTFGAPVFWVNLAWQMAALVLVGLLCARAFGWQRDDAWLLAAMLVASWDYTGWSLNGLITGGWLLPVAVAAWGLGTRRPLVAGVGIAWAGLIKVFPFVMLLAPAAVLAKAAILGDEQGGIFNRQGDRTRRAWIPAAQTIGACAAATLVLGWLSTFTGASWSGFADKIASQFVDAGHSANAVGFSSVMFALGIQGKLAIPVLHATVLFCVAWMLWTRCTEEQPGPFAFRTMVLVSCVVFLSGKWLNYYAIVALCLVPTLARRHRHATVFALAVAGLGYALPEFGQSSDGHAWAFLLVKTSAYQVLPLLALVSELRSDLQSASQVSPRDLPARLVFRRGAIVAAAGAVCAAALVAHETYVRSSHRAEVARGEAALSAGDLALARTHLARAAALVPGDARTLFDLASLAERLGRSRDAIEFYRGALAADPEYPMAGMNLGVLYMETGDFTAGVRQLRKCADRVPHDQHVQFNLAQALTQVGNTNGALKCLEKALLIDPGLAAASNRLAEITARKSTEPQK